MIEKDRMGDDQKAQDNYDRRQPGVSRRNEGGAERRIYSD